jgi:mono/diheme cytochrome c family protein
MTKTGIAVLAVLVASLAACGNDTGTGPGGQTVPATTGRVADPVVLARGAQLFRANCAVCHGQNGEGAPNWHKQGADGKWPAPPLNGTGHAWHHPYPVLVRTIREGTQTLGGAMPAWQGKLADADIEAIIAWFQSRWPDEIYIAWAEMDRQARTR